MSKRLLTVAMLSMATFVVAQQNNDNDQVARDQASSNVLAEWNNGRLTREDMEIYLSGLSLNDQATFLLNRQRASEALQDQLLRSAIMADADLDSILADTTVQMQLEKARRKILFEAYRDQYVEQRLLDDYEPLAEERYLLNKKAFMEPETRTVTHVLISTKERTDEAAKQLAEKLQAQLMSGEITLQSAVEQYSDDPSASANQGQLEIKPGTTVPPFEQTSYALDEIGDISVPVKTTYGYHIIRLDAINPARQMPFEEVRERLMHAAKVDHKEKLWSQYLTRIQQQAGTPKVYQDNVSDFIADYLTQIEGLELLTNRAQ